MSNEIEKNEALEAEEVTTEETGTEAAPAVESEGIQIIVDDNMVSIPLTRFEQLIENQTKLAIIANVANADKFGSYELRSLIDIIVSTEGVLVIA